MKTIIDNFIKYFWHITFFISMFTLVGNWFTGSLSEVKEVYHGLIAFIALGMIDIQRWLNK